MSDDQDGCEWVNISSGNGQRLLNGCACVRACVRACAAIILYMYMVSNCCLSLYLNIAGL